MKSIKNVVIYTFFTISGGSGSLYFTPRVIKEFVALLPMPKVTFLPSGITVDARPGTILLDVALDNNIRINHNCGGNCACATCQVHIEVGFDRLNPPTEQELDMLLDADNRSELSRLSCQCLVQSDLVVLIPPSDFDDDELI